MARKAEVIYVGDAASIVRASQEAQGAVDKSASGITKSHDKISGSFTNMAKKVVGAAAGFAAAYASIEGIKGAVDTTEQLATSTLKLNRVLGLSVQQASAWSAVAKARNIDSKQLSQAFGTLSKNSEAAQTADDKQKRSLDLLGNSHADMIKKSTLLANGAGAQSVAFAKLGITQNDLKKGSSDFQGLLDKVSQGFQKLPAGTDKAAIGMKLLGRGWQTLLPLMRGGAEGMDAQLAEAKKMGATFGGSTVNSLEKFRLAQEDAKYGTMGLQLAIGQYLAPVLTKAFTGVAKLIAGFRDGTGAGGAIKNVFNQIVNAGESVVTVVGGIVGWFQKGNPLAVALAGALSGVAIAITAVSVATKAAAIATAAWDAVLELNPLVALGTAIAVVIGALVALELKTHFVEAAWKAVRSAFAAVVGWIGGAAQTAFGIVKQAAQDGLLGPVGLIISRWNQIPGFFSGVWNAVVGAIKSTGQAVSGAVSGVFNGAVNVVKGFFNTFYDVGKFIISGLINGFKSLAGSVLSALKSVVMAPVNAVKSALGISSPSKVFHDIGVNIMQGLTNGLLSAKAIVQDGLNQSMLYPIDAAVAALTTKETALQATFQSLANSQQRVSLEAAIVAAEQAPASTSVSSGTTKSTISRTLSGASSTSGIPAAVSKMLGLAQSLVGSPYSKAGHTAAYDETVAQIKKFGTDCSGLVSRLLKEGVSGIKAAQTTQGLPTSAGLAKGAGKYVTVFDRHTGATDQEHTLIEIMGKFFESGGNSKFNPRGGVSQLSAAQARGELAGGGFEAFHPTAAGLNSGSGLSGLASRLKAKVTSAVSGKLNANQMRGLLYAAGFRGKDLDTAVAIGFAESQGDTSATNKNSDGSIDRGFMQVNSVHGKMSTTNPLGNAKSAYSIFKAAGGSFRDWVTYNSGKYKQYIGNTGSGKGSNVTTTASGPLGASMSFGGGAPSSKDSNISQAVAALKQFDLQAKQAQQLAKIDLQIKNLNQLNAFKNAITSLKSEVKDLASQAAQAWAALQTKNINATHDAAIAAITGGGDSTTLAAMQAQDTVDQNAATRAGLQSTLAGDQTLAGNSGGQAHLDALAQVKADQAAIDQFDRQQTEQQLQDNVDAATKKADDAQTIALGGLDQETADYQAGLDAQFQALTTSLNARKLTYAQWASDVNAILAPYGLSAATDPTTEGTITAGPGPAGSKPKAPATPPIHITWEKPGGGFGGHRAGGGPVQPGYVYRVGEQGPEDVMFGQRGTVMTAAQTRGNGGHTMNIEKAYFQGAQSAKATVDRLAYRAAIGTA